MSSIEEMWPDPDRRAGALQRIGETVAGRRHRNGHHYPMPDPQPRLELTATELRAIEAISHGLGINGAADVLGVSRETIKSSLKQSSRILGAKNGTHVVAIALRLGLIE